MSASSARGPRAAAKENNMSKPSAKSADKEMQPEYDFSAGVRGKHFRRYQRGTNVVVLEPDVAKFFSNAETVNDSLRALAGIIRRQKVVAK
jgi:hypothetical protein